MGKNFYSFFLGNSTLFMYNASSSLSFFCSKNKDVEQFLKEQSIEFTKKNQSVTYLLFAQKTWSLLGYFTLAIKPISLKAEQFSNTAKKSI